MCAGTSRGQKKALDNLSFEVQAMRCSQSVLVLGTELRSSRRAGSARNSEAIFPAMHGDCEVPLPKKLIVIENVKYE